MIEERTIFLGIDPSFVNMGAAIYNPETKHLDLKTGDFTSTVRWINKNCKLSKVIAIVENPALVSPVWKMWGMVESEVKAMTNYQNQRFKKVVRKATIDDVRSKFAIAMNHAQKVGENKAAAKYIISLLADKGVPVIEVSPRQRDRADTAQKKANKAKVIISSLRYPTKTTAAQFNELTGYTGRSSEHARDAATLIYGRKLQIAQAEIKEQEKKPISYPKPTNENFYLFGKDKSKEMPF